jgi:hypothetical protein
LRKWASLAQVNNHHQASRFVQLVSFDPCRWRSV